MGTPRAASAATPEVAAETPVAPIPDEVPGRKYDPRKRVYVIDSNSGEQLPNPVPETWLDGRFPNLSEAKAGK